MAHGFPLRVLDDVRVDVHGDADLGVPEDLHHDAGRDSGRREERGGAMPSVVQPDDAEAGGLGDAGEGAVDVPRLDLTAGAGGEDVAGLLPLLPRFGPASRLPHPMPAQGRDAEGGQRDGPATAALGVVVVEDAPTALGLLADVENAAVEVEVRPAQTDDLSPAEPHGDGEHEGRVERVLPGGREKVERLVEGPGLQFAVVGTGRPLLSIQAFEGKPCRIACRSITPNCTHSHSRILSISL